jgi:adenine-specific DNA-methyltransferase
MAKKSTPKPAPPKSVSRKNGAKGPKTVTRYTYNDIKEPRTPETGHTALLPADEQVVALPMDNGWSKAVVVGKLPEADGRPVVVDMDPAADPVLFWAGKRNRRRVPVLPLQRNEIVSESRIAQIIERARRAAEEKSGPAAQGHLFADLEKTLRETDKGKRVEFYTHDEGWKNKLICGDSLHVMESLLHYENLRGRVQMIYIDPPYGIKYDSNFQQRVDSTKNEEKDQADDVLTIKAFRDTWALGIHSYVSYLQERLYLCRELLAESGSVFVQISDENVHLVRALLDEVFGRQGFCSQITFQKTGSQETTLLGTTVDYLLWYAKDRVAASKRYRQLYILRKAGDLSLDRYDHIEFEDGTSRRLTTSELRGELPIPDGRRFQSTSLLSDGETKTPQEFIFEGRTYAPKAGNHWKTPPPRLAKLAELGRILLEGTTLRFKRYADDFDYVPVHDRWESMQIGRARDYVVQTAESVVERCIQMSTQPGELVFDPTCGSGTTAFCSERLGRRWITCDTSRVAINVARKRLLSAVLSHYTTRNGTVSSDFVYKTTKRVTLESLAKGLEAEEVTLFDDPIPDTSALRVCGPFEVMSLGRYSVEDWKGYVVRETASAYGEPAKLENYIEVICRLYRKDAAIQGASGLVHAVAENEKERIAISVGPLSGRVTAKQINDAVQDALSSGILEAHVLGWAFEANVGEVKSALEKRGKVKVELIMIRPDTLAEGLKATQPEMLFSPLALPDIGPKDQRTGKLLPDKQGNYRVTLNGVALFDRKRRTTEYKGADSGYVSAWYLDEDYDGDCFVDCQMFFDFKKVPNIKAALRAEVEPEEFKLKLTSEPFAARSYKRVAVKVVDVYGNESVVVRDLA